MPVEAKPLFRPDVLRPHLQAFQLPQNLDATRDTFGRWSKLLTSRRADKLKEKELLPIFLKEIFGDALGYSGPADNSERYTMSLEQHVEVAGEYADAALGVFGPDEKRFIVAVEGKGPTDPLDRPYSGRRISAVQQALNYAVNLPCEWYVVTSMRQTRLYFKGADQFTFERFDTERLANDPAQLKRFLFLLGADRVVPETGECHLFELFKASEKAGKQLTKEFYVEYTEMRQNAFDHLCAENPKFTRDALLTATQKLLDRILFCAFCEDRGLLPSDTIKKAYEHRGYVERPIWDNFRDLFRAIDVGNEPLKIPAYNGGLFAHDPSLDDLKLTNEICDYFRNLAEYDYRQPSAVSAEEDESKGRLVDVDILGHIFEQSITDLEQLRNELDGRVEPVSREKHTTRRKKEGAFYTPAFITRYIVEQALGSVLRDRFESLRSSHEAKAKGTAKTALGDPTVYDVDLLKAPQKKALVTFWEAWQDELKTVKIVDPACGSGAFLIEAFDQLHMVYQTSNDRLEELRGSRSLFDPDRTILQHNLYGVDLNEEAVEICKLSLWIKTAARGKALTSLDDTIKVGNSVVNDPAVHPRAFDWKKGFPKVFKNGGFDVVVGNPPYIRQEWLAPFKEHWQASFASFHGVADIFAYFFELGAQLLRSGGRLGYITSGSWIRGNFGAPLRLFIAQNVAVESMVDFGEYQPFEEAELIRPTIVILRKDQPGGIMKLFKWLINGSPPENLSEVIQTAPTMRTDHLGAEAWELDPDEVLALRLKLASNGTPLLKHSGPIYRGVVTGLNEAFMIDNATRKALIAEDGRSAEIIKPIVQGTHLRSWYVEDSAQFLIFTRRGIRIEDYPAILSHLEKYRKQLEPKPSDWTASKTWSGRKQGTYRWFEIQDVVDFWPKFERTKIVWPDITNSPRFSVDASNQFIGDTCFMIPVSDYYVVGVLSSWATWFYISKTAQPLRLRSDRWQFRLKAQYLEKVPIPVANDSERAAIANLAESCSTLAAKRYELETQFRRRLVQVFGVDPQGAALGRLNIKAEAWWEQSLNELGSALKSSFKLSENPFKSPRTADEWEPYLTEKRNEVTSLRRQLADAEVEINARVYKLFKLTPKEIKLLEREVEH